MRSVALKPTQKVPPQTVLNLAADAAFIILTKKLAGRINHQTGVSHPPIETEGITVGTVVTGNIGQRPGLPATLNQAGFTSVFKSHYQIPRQPISAVPARVLTP